MTEVLALEDLIQSFSLEYIIMNLIFGLLFAGPSDAPLAPTTFEAFVKVPSFLRPHTQIYCTR